MSRPKSSKPKTDVIRWEDASVSKPYSGRWVLIECPEEDEPIWFGFWAVDGWRTMDGQPVVVVRWAEMPVGVGGARMEGDE